VEKVGFPSIMISVGVLNICYAPVLFMLKNSSVAPSTTDLGNGRAEMGIARDTEQVFIATRY
jgi:hypothetical protein